jgi:Domain of unknown function (DUF4262)
MDVATLAWLDQENAHIGAIIRRYGWFIQYVYGDPICTDPGCSCSDQDLVPFAYTVGLFGMNHPELLIFGVSQETAGGVLNELGDRIRAGEDLLAGQLITFERWPHKIVPEDVPNPGEIVLSANRFYQRSAGVSVPVLQLTYDDKAGRFPWDPGYAAPGMQPRPGTFRA